VCARALASQVKVRLSPAGLHLFNRATGTNVLLDEITVPLAGCALAPRHVSIALTNACDLNCAYCYAPKQAAALQFRQITSWLHELDMNGCIGIGFGGGEPTLYPKLPDLCRYAAISTNLAVTLTTHGHRLDEVFARRLKGYVHFIRVSMDGVGATYEELRGRTFEQLRRRFAVISELAPFGINYVVNSQTFPDLDPAVALAKEIGAVEFLLLPEQRSRNSFGIDGDTSNRLRAWVREYNGPVRLSVSEPASAGLPVCAPFASETGLRSYAHIDAFGTLKRSSFDAHGITIGDRGVIEALRALAHTEGTTKR
jgi:MoaA/NifB/PqqE/SkfB family radical SAM enzyme